MLSVENLSVMVKEKKILDKVTLNIEPGKITALMGPNGSGKTTLAYTIAGRRGYDVIEGKIILDGEDITNVPPEERSIKGIFLVHQSPPEIPGVKLSTLLVAMTNKRRGVQGNLLKISDPKFYNRVFGEMKHIGLDREFLFRDLNKGLSGGEKKRSELLQLLMVKPKYAILDEPDSGMDIDGLKIIAEILETLRRQGVGVLLITHYTRLFNHIVPDRVAIMVNGKIFAENGPELSRKVEEKGYKRLLEEGI